MSERKKPGFVMPQHLRLELQAISAGQDGVEVGWWALVEHVRREAGDEAAEQVKSLASDLRVWERALLRESLAAGREAVRAANRQGCDYFEPL